MQVRRIASNFEVMVPVPEINSLRDWGSFQAGDELDLGNLLLAQTLVVGDKQVDFGGRGACKLDGVGRTDGQIAADPGVKGCDPQVEGNHSNPRIAEGMQILLFHITRADASRPDKDLTHRQRAGIETVASCGHAVPNLSDALRQRTFILQQVYEQVRIPEDLCQAPSIPAADDTRIGQQSEEIRGILK